MLRLLLEEDRKIIKKEYLIRFLTIFSVLLSIVFVFWILFLLPTFINVFSEERIIEKKIGDPLSRGSSEDVEILKDKFSLLRNKVKVLDKEQYIVTDIIRQVTENQVRSISLNSIAFAVREEGQFVSLQGLANNRESLVEFSNQLESVDIFENVDVPFSNFTKDIDIPFSMTISLKELNKSDNKENKKDETE